MKFYSKEFRPKKGLTVKKVEVFIEPANGEFDTFSYDYEYQTEQDVIDYLKKIVEDMKEPIELLSFYNSVLAEAPSPFYPMIEGGVEGILEKKGSQLLQTTMGVLLADCIEVNSHKETMHLSMVYLSSILICGLLLANGIEENINGYRLRFDQTKRYMDLGA